MSVVARRRTLAGLLALAVLAVAAVLLLGRGGKDEPPATAAAQLVPSNALVYVHVSTDTGRPEVKRAQTLAARFPSYARLRDSILRRLAVNGRGGGNISDWLGDEASLALLPGDGQTAGSLVVVKVRDEQAARDYLAAGRGGDAPTISYKGLKLTRYGNVVATFSKGFLLLGQQTTVQAGVDLAQGRGKALAADPSYQRTLKGLPADRVLDAYSTADGVTRLLSPAGGVLGIAGLLLDRPGLRSTAVALSATDPGARLTVHTLGDPGTFKPFSPKLLAAVPRGSLAYLGLQGFDRAAARLLVVAGSNAGKFAKLIADNRAALKGEVAVVLGADRNRTVLTLIAPAPKGAKDSVVNGNLVLSTSPAGVQAVRRGGGLSGEDAFKRTVSDVNGKVTAVGFLDFDQLLKLAERTGLNDSQAYQAVRADLAQLRAVGLRSAGSGGDTTAEIRFDIP